MDYKTLKMNVTGDIIKAAGSEGGADYEVLMATLKSETGLTAKLIAELVKDQITIGKIMVKGNRIYLIGTGHAETQTINETTGIE